MFKRYYYLTKPGIVRGNMLSLVAGYVLGSSADDFEYAKLIWVIIGSSLVVASGCVLNNFIDRDIDSKMSRTKSRALVKNEIGLRQALAFGLAIGALGYLILFLSTNLLTVFVGLIGYVFYVYVYGWFKRRTDYGTLVGSISGATPPLVGYTASSGNIDLAGWLIFFVLVFWQMPHFYAIAIFRRKEYKKAKIPVMPLTRGIDKTKMHVLVHFFLFLCAVFSLWFFGFTGRVYLLTMSLASTYWFYIMTKYWKIDSDRWARKVFGSSLVVMLILFLSIVVDKILT